MPSLSLTDHRSTIRSSAFSLGRPTGPTGQDIDFWEHAALLYHGFEWQDALENFLWLAHIINNRDSQICCALNAALIEVRLGEYAAARGTLQVAYEGDANNPLITFLAAIVEWEAQNFAKAKASLDMCMRILRSTGTVDYRSQGLDFRLRFDNVHALSKILRDRLSGGPVREGVIPVPAVLPAESIFEAPARPGTEDDDATSMFDSIYMPLHPAHDSVIWQGNTAQGGGILRDSKPPPLRIVKKDTTARNNEPSDVSPVKFPDSQLQRQQRYPANLIEPTNSRIDTTEAGLPLPANERPARAPPRPPPRSTTPAAIARPPSIHQHGRNSSRSSNIDKFLPPVPQHPPLPDVEAIRNEAIRALDQLATRNETLHTKRDSRKEIPRPTQPASIHKPVSGTSSRWFGEPSSASIFGGKFGSVGFSINATPPLPTLSKQPTKSSQKSSITGTTAAHRTQSKDIVRLHAADLTQYHSWELAAPPSPRHKPPPSVKSPCRTSAAGSSEKKRSLKRFKSFWRLRDKSQSSSAGTVNKQQAAKATQAILPKEKLVARDPCGEYGDIRALARFMRENDHLAPLHLQFPPRFPGQAAPAPTKQQTQQAAFLASAGRDRLCLDRIGDFSYNIAREDLLIGAPMPWANAAIREKMEAGTRHSAPKCMECQSGELYGYAQPAARTHGHGHKHAHGHGAAGPSGLQTIAAHAANHDDVQDEVESIASFDLLMPNVYNPNAPSPAPPSPSPAPSLRAISLPDPPGPNRPRNNAPYGFANLHTAASSTSDLFAGATSHVERQERAQDAALRMLEGRDRGPPGEDGDAGRHERLVRMRRLLFSGPTTGQRVAEKVAEKVAGSDRLAVQNHDEEIPKPLRIASSKIFGFRGV